MSRDFWHEFLQLYKGFPCLWDVKDPCYVRRDLKKQAYDVLIAKIHEVDATANLDTVKRKIDSFRTAFRREEKKVIMSIHSGATEEEIYTPTLWYYRELEEFLGNNTEEQRNLIISRTTFNNEDESDAMMNVEHLEDEFSEESSEEKYTPPPKKRSNIADKRSAQPPRIFVQSIPVPQTTAAQSCAQTCTQTSAQTCSQTCAQTEAEDDCATFAAHLKLQMREITKDQKFIAQKLISDVMFFARTNRLTYDSSVAAQRINNAVATADVLPNKSDSSVQINSSEF